MGKQPNFPRGKVKEIRMKIRAVIENNPALQAKVDQQLAAPPPPKNKAAARAKRRKIYSDLIRDNALLAVEVRKIIQVMSP